MRRLADAGYNRHSLVGRTLSHYQITAKLGEGGMGEVFLAEDTRLDRMVALKVLPEELATDPVRLERFEREAKSIAALNHPNIVTVFSVEEADGEHLLTMELVEGKSLDELLPSGGFDLETLFGLSAQIADGLAAAHEKGITHRDLKPANVMVTEEGRVKILDFGLAKLAETASEDAKTELLTQEGSFLGTPHYMSPEQIEGGPVDPRSDIFSLGILLYEMATGERPFKGDHPASVISAVLKDQPPPVTDLKVHLPRHFGRIVRRCLEKKPARRYQLALDVRLELEELEKELAEESTPRPAPPAAPPKRSPARFGLIAALLAAAIAGAGIYRVLVTLGAPGGSPDLALKPEFRALSFHRGYVHSARFTPDGKTVLYGAAFKGDPVRVFSTRTDGTAAQSRLLEWPSADVTGISDNGDVALLLDRHHIGSWLRVGTLAQVPLSGGAPRIIHNEVYAADISPDGSEFAIVTATATEQQLEFPIGSVVFRTPGWISHPRISPDGSRVAFAEHPYWGDDMGYVAVAEAGGDAERLDPSLHNGLQGVAWSPSGEAVWYTGASPSGVLWSVEPGRSPRVLLGTPDAIQIQDTAPSGEILLTNEPTRTEISGRLEGDDEDRLYSSWADESATGIAEDGTVFAGSFQYEQLSGEYKVFFGRAGEPSPIQLGLGSTGGITPDGTSVFAALRTRDQDLLQLYPTGPGQARTIDLDGIVPFFSASGGSVTASRHGRRIAFLGAKKGSGTRVWVLDLEGGAPRAITPVGFHRAVLSPDGARVAVRSRETGLSVYPVDGGDAQPVPGTQANEEVVAWSSDQRAIFVWDQTFPATVHRVDLASGAREPVRTIEPGDPAGILYGSLVMTTDARYYLLRFRRTLSQLYHVPSAQ